MGTKKRVHKKPKKTNKRQKYRGGDQDNCEGYRVKSDGTQRCHRCRRGFLPNLEGKCKVEKGNAIELREKGVLPNCERCITSDNDYSYEGYLKNPDKKYDCTICKNNLLLGKKGMFTPLGPPGNRRCEPMFVPIDPNNKDHCKMVENDSCTVCDVGYVPAGPFGRKRCILAGQMWNGVVVGEEPEPAVQAAPAQEAAVDPKADVRRTVALGDDAVNVVEASAAPQIDQVRIDREQREQERRLQQQLREDQTDRELRERELQLSQRESQNSQNQLDLQRQRQQYQPLPSFQPQYRPRPLFQPLQPQFQRRLRQRQLQRRSRNINKRKMGGGTKKQHK